MAVAVFCYFATDSRADSSADSQTSTYAEIDSFILAKMELAYIPGLAASIVRDGQVVWSKGYGYADIDNQIAVTDTTPFLWASVSKLFVATALMQLWEEGHFDLDDPINDHLPFTVTHPIYWQDTITIRMLTNHTSGLRDYWPVLNGLVVEGDSPMGLLNFLQDYLVAGGIYYSESYNFTRLPPGDEFVYCNVGSALLGYVVEFVSGMPFEDYCRDSIFVPLGMSKTAWRLADLNPDSVAIPYEWTGSEYGTGWWGGHYGVPWFPAALLRSGSEQMGRFLAAYMNWGE